MKLEGAAVVQVSNSMGYSQRWRQFDKTTRKDPKSLNLCSLVQVSMPFMQLRLHLSHLCNLFSLSANLKLSCLYLFGLLLYRPDLVLPGLCCLMFIPGCFSVDQNTNNFHILAWLCLLFVFSSLLVLISHFHHSLCYFTGAAVLSSLYIWKKGHILAKTSHFLLQKSSSSPLLWCPDLKTDWDCWDLPPDSALNFPYLSMCSLTGNFQRKSPWCADQCLLW